MAAKEPEVRKYPPPPTEKGAQAIFEYEGGEGSYKDFLAQDCSNLTLAQQLERLHLLAMLIPHVPR